MNIYDFFISPDIIAHCEKIGHVFNSLEMAVIIANSEKTIKEKHAAWREIIAGYPDMPVHESLNFKAKESLHDFLREFITWEEKYIADFYAPAPNVVYRSNIHYSDRECSKPDSCYSSAEKAWKAIYENYDRQVNSKIISASIMKEFIDEDDYSQLWLNVDGEPLQYAHRRNWSEVPDDLGDIFIHIPVPFAKGDLVEYHGHDGKAYVLMGLVHWQTGINSYEKLLAGGGDGSDMIAHINFIYEGQLLFEDSPIGYHIPYYGLKFFKGELQGQDRFLKYLSEYIKMKETRENSLDWLIGAFCKFQREAESAKINKFFGNWFRNA